MLCVAATDARADFELCNKGSRQPVQVAFAWREAFPGNAPWSLNAWQEIAPNDCATLVRGNMDGYEVLIHAQAKGVTLTSRFASNNVFDSQEKFCLFNAAVRDRRVKSAADSSSCGEGELLRSFAIRHAGIFEDGTVNLFPDEVAASVDSRDHLREPLSAYFGAVFSAMDGYVSASATATSREQALRKGLEICTQNSTRADTCELRYEYADRCVALVYGDKEGNILVAGRRGGTEAEVKQWGLMRCEARGNTGCNVSFSICSTHSASMANQSQRELENLNSVVDFLLRDR